MKNLLIPIDRSNNDWQRAACIMALYPQAEVQFYLLDKGAADSELEDTEPTALQDCPAFQDLKQDLKQGQKIIALGPKADFIKNVKQAIAAYDIELIFLGNQRPNEISLSASQENRDLIARVKCPVFLFPKDLKCRELKQMVLLTDFQFTYKSKATTTLSRFARQAQAHLHILQLCKKSSPLSADQKTHQSYLENSLEQVPYSHHFVVHQSMDQALQFFINAHAVDLVVIFAKHINLCESLLFKPAHHSKIKYHEQTCFMIIHE